ncbi:tetratricopeptide repeat protein [uncultured Roseibium sp.]|uniref:tetratricopeptide repeat protein n=1 Tax=uncultured Roseibium sp. TaxID=1936171 RepID=UPI00262EF4BB|nr:tetratricopeptide repeat protein [uncultured Roseibium sp.]
MSTLVRIHSPSWIKVAIAATLILLTAPLPAASATPEQDALFRALKNASNEVEAKKIENQIWEAWLNAAPNPAIRERIDEAMSRRGIYDFQGAKDILDEVVEEAPDYSEGWNQRAFVLFLQGNYDESLEDIDRVLELEPRHFGALSGKAMIFLSMGRAKLGQKLLRQAVEIHPYLNERNLLIKPKGTDL